MSTEREQLKERFDSLFTEDGLTNIKFFVRGDASTEQIWAEVNKMQKTIAKGEFSEVDSVDKHVKTMKFDEPF